MSAPDIAVTILGSDQVEVDEFGDGTRIDTVAAQRVDELAVRRARRAATKVKGYRSRSAHYARLLVVTDVAAAAVAVGVTGWLTELRPERLSYGLAAAVIALVVWPAVIGLSHGHRRRQLETGIGSRAVLTAMTALVLLTVVPATWLDIQPQFVRMIAIAAPIAAISSIIGRTGVRSLRRREQRAGAALRRVILAGNVGSVTDLYRAISRERRPGMDVVGVCVPTGDLNTARDLELPVVGELDQTADVVRDLSCDAVAVAGVDGTQEGFLRRLAWSLEGSDADVLVHPGLIDVAHPRMHIESHDGLSLLQIDQPQFAGWQRRLKRATDIGLTSVGLFFCWPLLAAVALAVKLEDRGGPVIFKQTRVGIDGKPFTMYKFRSMVVDAEQRLADLAAQNEGAGPLFKMEHDPRITRVGAFIRKYSIDELPQLFNVLGGSMSLVGPRPPLQSEVSAYATDTLRRLKVVPGLTGLWQVSGRSLLSWEESIRLDLKYVENWSVGLDLHILIRTVSAVFANRGAF